MPRYACETRVVSGLGCVKTIPDELKYYKISKPALVVDDGIAKAGLLEQWLPKEVAQITPRVLCPVNPSLDQVQKGVDEAKSHECDGVLIIGGGSAICMGKAIAICLVNPGHILDYEGNEKLQKVYYIEHQTLRICHSYVDSCQFTQYVSQQQLVRDRKCQEYLCL